LKGTIVKKKRKPEDRWGDVGLEDEAGDADEDVADLGYAVIANKNNKKGPHPEEDDGSSQVVKEEGDEEETVTEVAFKKKEEKR